MNKLKPFLYGVILVGFSPALYAAAVTFTVDPTQNNSPISPYIYGSNSAITNVANTYYRCGGNRLSAYNWETNWSNAGSDYYYENDTLMGSLSWGPGGTAVTFLNQNKARGADSLWTLELAGYVSANGETPVQVPTADFMAAPGQTDPHGNFFPVTFVKGSPFADPPNTADGVVYMDESVNYFVNHLGKAGSGGSGFTTWTTSQAPGPRFTKKSIIIPSATSRSRPRALPWRPRRPRWIRAPRSSGRSRTAGPT